MRELCFLFENLDVDLAKQVIEYDDQLDQIEQKVIITAFEIIALQQPVARDLRFIVSSINIILVLTILLW